MPRQRSICSRSSPISSAIAASCGSLPLQFLGDERDGRERRAELVRGCRGEPVELRQVLLAGEHELGGGERLRELARFLRHAPGVDAR